MKNDIQEKLDRLKNVHSKSAQDARDKIKEWDESYGHLKTTDEWLKHPETIALAETAREQVARISQLLASDPDISETDRKGLFDKKQVHLVYLIITSRDVDSEMKAIEEALDYELGETDEPPKSEL